MDNELGIIGYEKKEICKQNNNSILMNIFGIYSFLSIMTILVFYTIKFNIILIAISLIIVLIFCVIFTLIEIKNNKNEKNNYLYVYFKDKFALSDYYNSNNYFDECINCILENNIKPIKNNDNDYYFTNFKIYDDERMNIYNKLKNQYEIINF